MAKTTPPASEPASVLATAKPYEVIGLLPAETLPIEFRGQRFDLNALSEQQLAYLLEFPAEVPYLKRKH